MAYVTSATTKGGRNGRAMLDNGGLALAMALPKEVGGAGDGHNPEQLFALGYSACYGQAILGIAKKHGLDGQAARVTCEVTWELKTVVMAEVQKLDSQSKTFGVCSADIPFSVTSKDVNHPWIQTQ